MATAEDYAQWIIDNQDKQGTPDFETVAAAYEEAKAAQSPTATIQQEQPTEGGLDYSWGRIKQGAEQNLTDLQKWGGQLLTGVKSIPSQVAGLAAGAASSLGYDIPQLLTTGETDKQLKAAEAQFKQRAVSMGADPTTFEVGKVFGTGAEFGGALSALGKSDRLVKWIAGSTKNPFRRTIAKTLEQGSSKPLATMGVEGATAAISQEVSDAVTKSTGNEWAGLAAGITSGGALATKLYSDIFPVFHLNKEARVERAVADHLRHTYSPEQIAQFENDLGFQIKHGLGVRLDLATQDPSMAQIVKDLGAGGNATVARLNSNFLGNVKSSLDNLIDARVSGAITPDKLEAELNTLTEGFQNSYNQYIQQIETAVGKDGVAKTSQSMFKVVDRMFEEATKAIDAAYSKVDMTQRAGAEARGVLKDAIGRATSHFAVSEKVVPQSVKEAASLLRAEMSGKVIKEAAPAKYNAAGQVLQTAIAEVRQEGLTLGGLKEIRSQINDMASSAAAAGNNEEARSLKILAQAVTDTFDNTPVSGEFKAANDLYKTIRQFKDQTSLYSFFKENKRGVENATPQQFASRFLFGNSSIDEAPRVLAFADSPLGSEFGFTRENVRNMALDGLSAKLKFEMADASGAVAPQKVRQFVAENKEIIDAYGLSDNFTDLAFAAKKAESVKLNKDDISKLAIRKYAESRNPDILRGAVRSGALWKELGKIKPEHVQPVKDAALQSLLMDGSGEMRSLKVVADDLAKYGGKLGMTPADRAIILKLMNLQKEVPSSSVDRLERLTRTFAEHDAEQAAKQALLNPLYATVFKTARILDVAQGSVTGRSNKQILRNAMFTKDGARKIFAMTKYDPDSRAVVAWLLGRTPVAISAEIPQQQNQ